MQNLASELTKKKLTHQECAIKTQEKQKTYQCT